MAETRLEQIVLVGGKWMEEDDKQGSLGKRATEGERKDK